MNTQYEKRSICIAKANYRARERGRRLKGELMLFFAALTGVCTILGVLISEIRY